MAGAHSKGDLRREDCWTKQREGLYSLIRLPAIDDCRSSRFFISFFHFSLSLSLLFYRTYEYSHLLTHSLIHSFTRAYIFSLFIYYHYTDTVRGLISHFSILIGDDETVYSNYTSRWIKNLQLIITFYLFIYYPSFLIIYLI